MNRLFGLTKALLVILLLLISVGSLTYFGWHKITYIISLCCIVLIFSALIIVRASKRRKIRQHRKLRLIGERKKAKILAVESFKNKMVLQLLIKDQSQNYISSILIDKPNYEQKEQYVIEKSIDVFTNPKNKHEILFAYDLKVENSKFRFGWSGIFITIVSTTGLWLPLLFYILEEPNRDYQGNGFVNGKNGELHVWELYYESPNKIIIEVYDPVLNTKIKQIEDIRDKDFEYTPNFFISEQGQNVVIASKSYPPVYDVYDAVKYRKISGIKEFEQNNKNLNEGIAKIEDKKFEPKFLREDIIEILTTKGNKYYYNINKDHFFGKEKDVDNYFKQADKDLMGNYLYTFALSKFSDNQVDRRQLYAIDGTSKKGIDDLLECAGISDLNLRYFDKKYHYRYKYCDLIPLLKDEYFINGKISYFDFNVVVIKHMASADRDAAVHISGFDESGNKIFDIVQADYPNIAKMVEKEGLYVSDYYLDKIVRKNDQIIINFKRYGALGIDIKTGKILWKYEPDKD